MKRFLPLLLAATFLGALPAAPHSAAPEIAFDSAANALTLPDDIYLGEVGGVATNSKGDIFVYTRTGHPTDLARRRARLRPWRLAAVPVRSQRQVRPRDRKGQLCLHVRPTGAHRSAGQHLGRRPDDRHGHQVRPRGPGPDDARPQAGGRPGSGAGAGSCPPPARLPAPARRPTSSIDRPTSPGTAPATSSSPTASATSASPSSTRTACSSSPGARKGTEPGQFGTARAIAVDAQGNVYVADPRNKRIQVFDNNGTFKTADHQCRHAAGALHHAGAESGPLQLEFQSAQRHRRRRRDLQAEAGRNGDRQVRQSRPVAEGVQLRQRHRLPHREQAVRRRDRQSAGAEARAALRRVRLGRTMERCAR